MFGKGLTTISSFQTSSVRRVVIVGDPAIDKTGVMYEHSFASRGAVVHWVSLRDVLGMICTPDGTSLLQAAEAEPHVARVEAERYSLPQNAFDVNPGTVVLLVNNEFDAYAWIVVQCFANIGAIQPNTAQSIRAANNKWVTHKTFVRAGLPVAKGVLVRQGTEVESVLRRLQFPIVLKELEGAQGSGVRLVRDADEFRDSCEQLELFRQPLLAEHYIECGAIDKRMLMVEQELVGAMERHARSGDFRANIALGGYGERCDVSAEELRIVRRAVRALGLRFVGMDLAIVHDVLPDRGYLPLGSPFLIEANPLPGLAGLRAATGVDASENLIDFLLSEVEAVERPVA